MGTLFTIVGIACCILMGIASVIVIYGVVKDVIDSWRKPTPREKAELDNSEYDWGHNVKNYMEE